MHQLDVITTVTHIPEQGLLGQRLAIRFDISDNDSAVLRVSQDVDASLHREAVLGVLAKQRHLGINAFSGHKFGEVRVSL